MQGGLVPGWGVGPKSTRRRSDWAVSVLCEDAVGVDRRASHSDTQVSRAEAAMSEQIHSTAFLDGDVGKAEAITEVRREAALLKTGALQNAIFNSANFSSIATDEKGVIQLFNVGAER